MAPLEPLKELSAEQTNNVTLNVNTVSTLEDLVKASVNEESLGCVLLK